MAIGDSVGEKTVQEANQDLNAILDRLNGTTLTFDVFGQKVTATLTIPEKK